ncbi:MAG: methyltransferase domain-containing protein [Bacteroidia bacterium]
MKQPTPTAAGTHTHAVRTYYDRNTGLFLRLGKDRGTRHIHQALWAEGVHTQAEAVQYANSRVLAQLRLLAARFPDTPLGVLDLGCGVGSGLFYLHSRYEGAATLQGLTISPVQAAQAQAQAHRLPGGARVRVDEGDFLDLSGYGPQHLAYAIEAFLHAASAGRFLAGVAQRLVPGGRLVLIDDFLTPAGGGDPPEPDRRWLAGFRRGWLAGSLHTVADVAALAAQQGLVLVSDQDFTSYMAIGRPRDRFIGLMLRLTGPLMWRSTYLRALAGGYSKQQCLRCGLVSYRELVFERT